MSELSSNRSKFGNLGCKSSCLASSLDPAKSIFSYWVGVGEKWPRDTRVSPADLSPSEKFTQAFR